MLRSQWSAAQLVRPVPLGGVSGGLHEDWTDLMKCSRNLKNLSLVDHKRRQRDNILNLAIPAGGLKKRRRGMTVHLAVAPHVSFFMYGHVILTVDTPSGIVRPLHFFGGGWGTRQNQCSICFYQLAGRHSTRQLQRRVALCLEWPGSIFGARLAIELERCIWLEFILQPLHVSSPYPASKDVSRCQSARKQSRLNKAEKPCTILGPIRAGSIVEWCR